MTQFKCCNFSTCDAPCPGQPKTVTTLEIIDQIHKLILEDQLGILREQVGSIIREELNMQKLSLKWVPKCLNMDEKCLWCQSSE